jgi:hypothetical protein
VRRLSGLVVRSAERWRDALARLQPGSDEAVEESRDPNSYLQVLLNDYTLLREDLQSVEQVTATLMSIAVALIGALGAFLLRVCDASGGGGCNPQPELWPPVYALLPLPPLAILGYVGTVGNVNTIRVYYLRLIERAISRESGDRTELLAGARALVSGSVGRRVPVPSFTHLQLELTSLRRGSFRARFLFLAIYIAVGVLFIGAIAFSLWLVEPTLEPPSGPAPSEVWQWLQADWRWLQVLAASFYSVAIAVLIRTLWVGSLGGRRFWLRMVQGLDAEWRRPLTAKEWPRREGRTITSYLVLPRPGDFVAKAPILPAAAAIAGWLSGTLGVDWVLSVLVFTFIFETLLYQARYILNDLRGLATDAAYSDFKRSTRFPYPPRPSDVRAAMAGIVGRVLLAWLLAGWLPPPYGWLARATVAIMVAHTILYESAKAWTARRHDNPLALTPARASVLVLVGAGYALRVCLGLILGQVGMLDLELIALAAIAFTALGSMFVTMVWAIDGLTQVPGTELADLPATRTTSAMRETPHILPLLSQADILCKLEGEAVSPRPEPAAGHIALDPFWRHRVLEPISSLTVWWNAAFLVACCVSASLGAVLIGDRSSRTALLTGAAGLVGGAILVLGYQAWWLRLAVTLGIGALVPILVTPGLERRGAAGVPVLLVAATYSWFRRATVTDIRIRPPDPVAIALGLVVGIRKWSRDALTWVIGRNAASVLWSDGDRPSARR